MVVLSAAWGLSATGILRLEVAGLVRLGEDAAAVAGKVCLGPGPGPRLSETSWRIAASFCGAIRLPC